MKPTASTSRARNASLSASIHCASSNRTRIGARAQRACTSPQISANSRSRRARRIDAARLARVLAQAEEVLDERRVVGSRRAQAAQPRAHLLAAGRRALVAASRPRKLRSELEQRREGEGLAVRRAARLGDRDAARAPAVGGVLAQPALADPRRAEHADHAAVAVRRAAQRGVECGDLALAAHEAREAARARGLDAGAVRAPGRRARSSSPARARPSSGCGPRARARSRPRRAARCRRSRRTLPGPALCCMRAASPTV